MEGLLAMLLANSWCSNSGEGGGVGRPYLVVRRGRREGIEGDFGREATSAHDIGFLGVAGVVACDVVGEAGGVASGEGGEGGVANATVA